MFSADLDGRENLRSDGRSAGRAAVAPKRWPDLNSGIENLAVPPQIPKNRYEVSDPSVEQLVSSSSSAGQRARPQFERPKFRWRPEVEKWGQHEPELARDFDRLLELRSPRRRPWWPRTSRPGFREDLLRAIFPAPFVRRTATLTMMLCDHLENAPSVKVRLFCLGSFLPCSGRRWPVPCGDFFPPPSRQWTIIAPCWAAA